MRRNLSRCRSAKALETTPAADEATRRRSIDAIDIGGTAASARITLVHGAVTFIDYFVLLKTAQGWKIANKAFHAQVSGSV